VSIFKKLKRKLVNLIREEVTELSDEFRARVEREVKVQAEAALREAVDALNGEVVRIADKIVIQIGKTIGDVVPGSKA
jgi:hypothetical protein